MKLSYIPGGGHYTLRKVEVKNTSRSLEEDKNTSTRGRLPQSHLGVVGSPIFRSSSTRSRRRLKLEQTAACRQWSKHVVQGRETRLRTRQAFVSARETRGKWTVKMLGKSK